MIKKSSFLFFVFLIYFFIYYLILPFYSGNFKNILNLSLFIFTVIFFFKLKIITLRNNFIRHFIYSYYFLYIIYLSLLQYYHLNSFFLTDNDVVSITEVILETSRGNFFLGPHYGDGVNSNYLSHHFSPILVIFIPFFKLIPLRITYCLVLLFFDFLSLLLWEKISFRLFKTKIAYFFIATLPLFNTFLFNLFTSYHFESLLVYFFLLFFYGYTTKSLKLEFLGYLFCLFIKEDIPIYFSMISIYFIFKKDPKRFFFYFIFSIFYYLMITYIQSTLDLSARVNWLSAWERWGSTKFEILFNIILHPLEVLQIFGNKKTSLFQLLSSVGFIPLFSLSTLPTFLSLYTFQILSDRLWYNTFYHYYCYTIIPVLFLGTFDALKNKRGKFRGAFLLVSFGIILYANKGNQDFPIKIKEIQRDRVESLNAVISVLPLNSSVNTSFDIGMQLPIHLRIFPLKKDDLQEFILIDSGGISPYYTIENINRDIEKYLAEKKIRLYYSVRSVKLYKRN